MTERIPKVVLVGGVVLSPFLLLLVAYSQPGYFTSLTYLGGLLLLEFLFAAIWMYRQVFFPLVLLRSCSRARICRWAPFGLWRAGWFWVWGLWWRFDRAGSAVIHFGLFHVIAFFAILAALVSAAVSRYTGVCVLKALSLLLLFLYAATGARLAVVGREPRFFAGLLIGCEIFVVVMPQALMLGREVMGNPNSLGAVMGVVAAPILLWGTLLSETFHTVTACSCFYPLHGLAFVSHARAASRCARFLRALCMTCANTSLFAQGLGVIVILVPRPRLSSQRHFRTDF